MKLKMDYKWVALSVTTIGIFMANVDGKHRGNRSSNNSTKFACKYR